MDDTRYISAIRSYTQSLRGVWNKGKAPGPVALDILEMFAHNESLSTYEVFSKLRSTRIKMAYKNVHKIIQRLLSLNLLIRAKKRRSYRNEHNAKYYKLSEFGIFRLFLTRHEGIIVDRLSTMSLEHPAIRIDKESIQFYGGFALFKTFISPFVEIRLLPVLDISLLFRTYEYLHQCCKGIERILKTEDQEIPFRIGVCSWNAIIDGRNSSDRTQLLLSLRTKFDLGHISLDEYIRHTKIAKVGKSDNELEILNPQFRIRLYLYRTKKKAIATHLQSRWVYEYEIEDEGSDVSIVDIQTQIDREIEREFGERNQLNTLVYQTVSTVGRAAIGDLKDRFGRLSTDENFMGLIEDVYNQFNHGRSTLLKLRR